LSGARRIEPYRWYTEFNNSLLFCELWMPFRLAETIAPNQTGDLNRHYTAECSMFPRHPGCLAAAPLCPDPHYQQPVTSVETAPACIIGRKTLKSVEPRPTAVIILTRLPSIARKVADAEPLTNPHAGSSRDHR